MNHSRWSCVLVLFILACALSPGCSDDADPLDSTAGTTGADAVSDAGDHETPWDIPAASQPTNPPEAVADAPPDEVDVIDDPETPAEEEPVPDVEYAPLICDLPDPAGLGEGVLFGGGANEGKVKAHVFDDADCLPIAGATVVVGRDVARVLTDENGYAEVSTTPGGVMVSAIAGGYAPWSYDNDAAVRYFRLRSDDRSFPATDSDEGVFRWDGEALAFTNPQELGGFFEQPATAGVVWPGISRATVLSRAYQGMETAGTFDINWVYDYEIEDDPIPFPLNFHLPQVGLEIDIPGIVDWGFWGGNETFRFPIPDGADVSPLNSFVFQIDLAQVVDIGTLLAFVAAAGEGGDLEAPLAQLLKPLLARGLTFPYAALEPDRRAGDGADIETTQVAIDGASIEVVIDEPAADYDYVFALLAEVPNRALAPIGVAVAEGGAARLPIPRLTDADYVLVAMRTDMFAGRWETQTMSLLVRYAEDPSEWRDGLVLSNADFGPPFDEATTTYDDDTGRLKWAFEDDASGMDAVLMTAKRYWYEPKGRYFSLLPADRECTDLPLPALGYSSYWLNDFALIAVDLPDDVAGGFDPTRIFGYSNARYTVWTPEPALYVILNGLLDMIEW